MAQHAAASHPTDDDDAANKEVWTTESDNNGNETRISTASVNGLNNQRDLMMTRPSNFVGVQSKFRRKYFHKVILIALNCVIGLLLLAIILMAVYYRLYYKNICTSKECVHAASNLLQSMDRQVDPCDDFYAFTCGNWAADHPRPDNAHSNDWFVEKQQHVLRTIRSFLQTNASSSEPGAVGEARVMYKACRDVPQIDSLGLQPVLDYLRLFALPTVPRILNISLNASLVPPPAADEQQATFDWVRTAAIIRRTLGSELLVGFAIVPNPTNRTVKLLAFGEPASGSMLPFKTDVEKRLDKIRRRRLNSDDEDDDDASDDDDANSGAAAQKAKIREAQTKYMTEIISALLFYADPTIQLADHIPKIMQVVDDSRRFEKALFKIQEDVENATTVDAANPLADIVYTNLSALQAASDRLIAPKTLPIWQKYLTTLFEQTPASVAATVATTPILTTTGDLAYLEQIVQLLADTSDAAVEFYVWWTVVDDLVLQTTSDVRELHADYMRSIDEAFASRVLRPQYCTNVVHELLGWAVSWPMVTGDQRDFATATGPRVAEMLANIRDAFDGIVRQATWMDDGTKCATLEKSQAMRSMIGYPEWLLNGTRLDEFYAGVQPMNASAHLANAVAVLRWRVAKDLAALHEEEDDAVEWEATPTNVNAFHTFQANAITIPLAILQFPFYNQGIEALNYGSIGTILGHELTHGFDDSGRMFDKDGNVRQWWTNSTVKEYVNRTACFTKQYSEYYVKEVDEHINGDNTLGENIADNGGLREAYYAYQRFVKRHGREMRLPGLEDYSSEQLFFMAYGNLWCEVQTLVSIRWALEDSHCPGKVRLKGVLQNSPEFAAAFRCGANATMIGAEQCRIW